MMKFYLLLAISPKATFRVCVPVDILLMELNLIPLYKIVILCFAMDRESVGEKCLELCI